MERFSRHFPDALVAIAESPEVLAGAGGDVGEQLENDATRRRCEGRMKMADKGWAGGNFDALVLGIYSELPCLIVTYRAS